MAQSQDDIREPPSELKTIIDNTARYVAKNGPAFEDRIKTKQLNNPKFKFLFIDDPLHSYYLAKVNEIRSTLLGNLNDKPQESFTSNDVPAHQQQSNLPSDEINTTDSQSDMRTSCDSELVNKQYQQDDHQSTNQHLPDNDKHDETVDNDSTGHQNQAGLAARSRKLDEYIEEKTFKLEEPPELNFLAKPAPSQTLMEEDIIKLTARYIATYGRSFLLDLINREHSNPIFDFTKPIHGQFTYMTNLIMQYALILNHPLGIVEELQKDIASQKQLVDKFKMRTEWHKMLDLERKEREENLEKEKLLYSQIDWHDFVIVETIDYEPDEKGEFPPTTAEQVGTRVLQQQRIEQTRVVPEEMDIDMEEDMDLDADQQD